MQRLNSTAKKYHSVKWTLMAKKALKVNKSQVKVNWKSLKVAQKLIVKNWKQESSSNFIEKSLTQRPYCNFWKINCTS